MEYQITDRFIVRKPQSRDEWEQVKTLLRAYRNEFDDNICFSSFEEEMENIEHLYAQKNKIKFIAIDSDTDQIVGCVALRALTDDTVEMKRLYVRPETRGTGLGKKLAEVIVSVGTAMGYSYMVLDTMLEMKAAQSLYQSMGFQEIPAYADQDLTKVVCFGKTLGAH